MKVITIGRSHDNDVRIDDPYVGRHHCQIVQHDNGVFAIVDMNSTNGTYVNGRRVFGEAQLHPYDSITIGHTNLPWRNYFPPKSKSYALPIVLGSIGGVLLTIVLTLLIFRRGSDEAFAFKGEYPDAVAVNMVDEDGTPYTIDAIEGQVCVWFDEDTPYKTAKKSIKASDGRIVAQIPENGYYLVEVPADKVQVFLKRITKENFVEWAYPNMISYPCMANNFVLDNFNYIKDKKDTIPHGVMVQAAMQGCGTQSRLKTYNIGIDNSKSMSSSARAFALDSISKLPSTDLIIINMSFGPYLRERDNGKRYYWNEATKKEKKDYKVSYLATIRGIIKDVSQLGDKDYIIVKSAGNNGVKEFDDEIIAYLRKELVSDELEIMDKHFIIVTAGEEDRAGEHFRRMKEYEKKYIEANRKKDNKSAESYKEWQDYESRLYNFYKQYSNEMGIDHYDPWVTKVDISDFQYAGEERAGTSFAAPRAACILSSVANERNLTGSELLELTREVTKRDGELTKEALLQAANEIKSAIDKNEVTIEGMLRMYLLDNMGGGSVTYYTDKDGNVINAVDENNSMHPYCQTIYEYRETDFDNTYLAFVVEMDKALDVTPYLEDGGEDFLWPIQSAITLSQKKYSGKEFASRYANKRVRAKGTLYVPDGGWRNPTFVVMDLREIELIK